MYAILTCNFCVGCSWILLFLHQQLKFLRGLLFSSSMPILGGGSVYVQPLPQFQCFCTSQQGWTCLKSEQNLVVQEQEAPRNSKCLYKVSLISNGRFGLPFLSLAIGFASVQQLPVRNLNLCQGGPFLFQVWFRVFLFHAKFMNLVHCVQGENLMLGLMGVIRRHVCGMCGAST